MSLLGDAGQASLSPEKGRSPGGVIFPVSEPTGRIWGLPWDARLYVLSIGWQCLSGILSCSYIYFLMCLYVCMMHYGLMYMRIFRMLVTVTIYFKRWFNVYFLGYCVSTHAIHSFVLIAQNVCRYADHSIFGCSMRPTHPCLCTSCPRALADWASTPRRPTPWFSTTVTGIRRLVVMAASGRVCGVDCSTFISTVLWGCLVT